MATTPTPQAYDLPATNFFAVTPNINIAYARVEATKKDVSRNPVILISQEADRDSRHLSRRHADADSTHISQRPVPSVLVCLLFVLQLAGPA